MEKPVWRANDEEAHYQPTKVIPDKEFRKYDKRPIFKIWSPILKGPMTDFFWNFVEMQHHPICGEIEMNTMKCLEAYGYNRGYRRCRPYLDDYAECLNESRQTARACIMRDERRRQYDEGERKVKYSDPPRMGSYYATGQDRFGNFYPKKPQ